MALTATPSAMGTAPAEPATAKSFGAAVPVALATAKSFGAAVPVALATVSLGADVEAT